MLAGAAPLVAVGVRPLGNWSLGQVLQHQALIQVASIEGYLKLFPWPVCLVVKSLYLSFCLALEVTPSRTPEVGSRPPPTGAGA